MQNLVEIENIEEMRQREGIDDVELRRAIRLLRPGDFVKLTLLTGPQPSVLADLHPSAGETLLVRITSIRGPAFRGKLAARPSSKGLSKLRVGAAVTFTTAHIHSLPKGQPTHER